MAAQSVKKHSIGMKTHLGMEAIKTMKTVSLSFSAVVSNVEVNIKPPKNHEKQLV